MSRSKAKAGRRRDRAEWLALIGEWRRSGCGVEEFCARDGLKPATFRWWCWRLSGEENGEVKSAPQWLSVDVASTATVASAVREGGVFELRWPDGLTLRVPAGFDGESLTRLLAALDTSSC